MSGDSSGLKGAAADADVGARPLGPRAVRPRGGRRRRDVGAGRLRVRARQSIAALVAKSWFLATEAGLQAELARATIRESRSSSCGSPRHDRAGRRRQRRGRVRRARVSVGTYRDALREIELAREQALRALETADRQVSGGRGRGRARSCRASPPPCRPGFRRSCSSAGPTSSPPSGASPPRSTASARPRRRGCRRSR